MSATGRVVEGPEQWLGTEPDWPDTFRTLCPHRLCQGLPLQGGVEMFRLHWAWLHTEQDQPDRPRPKTRSLPEECEWLIDRCGMAALGWRWSDPYKKWIGVCPLHGAGQ